MQERDDTVVRPGYKVNAIADEEVPMPEPTPIKPQCRAAHPLGVSVASLVLVACGGSGGSNEAPTATFTAPSTLGGGYAMWADERVVLDGSASSDPDGNALTHHWTVIARPIGSTPVLSDATSARPTFSPGKQGPYVVMLTVSDGALAGRVAREIVVGPDYGFWYSFGSLTVRLLEAGPAQCVSTGAAVAAAGTPLTTVTLVSPQWTLQAPAGSAAVLAGATGPTPGFVADVTGGYLLTWSTDYEEPGGMFAYYITADRVEVNAVPPRLAGTAYEAPSGMQVALLATRRSDLGDGFMGIEVDLRLRNPGAAALDEAPLHLLMNDGTQALPVDFVAQPIEPGDAGITLRTHAYRIPKSWTPMMWEYEPTSTPASARLLWCDTP